MRMLLLLAGLGLTFPAVADTIALAPTTVTEWKAVYGRVEAHYTMPARARLGGVVATLSVTEGDIVKAGQTIGAVSDEKLAYRIAALDAQLSALASQLETAETELARGQSLLEKGVTTTQRVDQLRTQADVVRNQIKAVRADRRVIEQQAAEGAVFAPFDGRILSLPATVGSVVMAGEPVAIVGGGGFFLRLAIPERHAGALKEGAQIRMTTADGKTLGKLVKIYPQIQNGRVVADVAVEGLDTAFVDARLLVEVPVAERQALMVPEGAVTSRSGLDFVTVDIAGQRFERVVVPGETIHQGDGIYIEILSGLSAGDLVLVP